MFDENACHEDVMPHVERPLPTKNDVYFVFDLYITGHTLRSIQAIKCIQAICEKHLHGQYQLQIIDVYQKPEITEKERITALPTLIRKQPLPVQRLIGDLTDNNRILAFFGLIENDQ